MRNLRLASCFHPQALVMSAIAEVYAFQLTWGEHGVWELSFQADTGALGVFLAAFAWLCQAFSHIFWSVAASDCGGNPGCHGWWVLGAVWIFQSLWTGMLDSTLSSLRGWNALSSFQTRMAWGSILVAKPMVSIVKCTRPPCQLAKERCWFAASWKPESIWSGLFYKQLSWAILVQ